MVDRKDGSEVWYKGDSLLVVALLQKLQYPLKPFFSADCVLHAALVFSKCRSVRKGRDGAAGEKTVAEQDEN